MAHVAFNINIYRQKYKNSFHYIILDTGEVAFYLISF